MDEVRIDEAAVEPKVLAVHADRRRPGRADFGNLALVELLREPSDALHADIACHEDGDDLAPVRGIRYGILLSIPLWGAMAAATWLFLRP